MRTNLTLFNAAAGEESADQGVWGKIEEIGEGSEKVKAWVQSGNKPAQIFTPHVQETSLAKRFQKIDNEPIRLKFQGFLDEYKKHYASAEPQEMVGKGLWVELANFDTQAKIRVGEIYFTEAEYKTYVKALLAKEKEPLKADPTAKGGELYHAIKRGVEKFKKEKKINTNKTPNPDDKVLRAQAEAEFEAISKFLMKKASKSTEM